MQDWIAGLLAVLGTLLVLAGGTLTVFKSLGTTNPPATDTTTPANSLMDRLRRLNGADRLVAWGVLLLVLGAIAAGAISFNLGASAGTE